MNVDESDFQDNDNNNVDENSNDHQYNQFVNYHDQYGNHNYVLDNDSHSQRAAQEQAVRERVYRRFNNSVDQPDRVPLNFHEPHLARPVHGTLHRRNYSEDLTLNTDSLPPLPQRNLVAGNADYQHPHSDRGLARLPVTRPLQTSTEEIRTEAEELLYNFTMEQFQNQNVDPSPIPARPYTNPTWARAGRDLRLLADAFSRSEEREILRRKAYQVNLSSITMDNFFYLCSELFQGDGGITQERIVVLFTFISDVAIQHVRIKAEQFIHRLMTWSLRFIFERICAWVQQAGGWGAVLNQGASFLFKSTLTVLASLAIVALSVYIIKTIKEL